MTVSSEEALSLEFRVRGRLQGVGLPPAVWRAARELGLPGEVLDDAEGVLLRVGGDRARVTALFDRLERALPPRAHIDTIESQAYGGELPVEFRIVGAAPDGGKELTPAPIKLPAGFERAAPLLAAGGDNQAAFCLLTDGAVILSPEQGDLTTDGVFDTYRAQIDAYRTLFDHTPTALAADLHPEYRSARWARAEAQRCKLELIDVQHHHAHLAACLVDNGIALAAAPVLGIVLDGFGFGDDGTLWGGEFLLADYRRYRRLARLKPVPTPGGIRAVREPWRCLYGHIIAAMGWECFTAEHSGLELHRYLQQQPLGELDRMMALDMKAWPTSSCGRLFDALAAALGICRDHQSADHEAAGQLEALAAGAGAADGATAYDFALASASSNDLWELDPAPMWRSVFRDLADQRPGREIAARFHRGLSQALVATVTRLAPGDIGERRFDSVALTGGCWRNRLLLESVSEALREAGFAVLTHADVSCGDAGLALGQAAVAAAHLLGD